MKINVDGLNIAYKFSGEGDGTAVILEGWGTSMPVYDSVAAIMSRYMRVLQFDLPGFGESDEPKEPWNVDAFTDFFLKLMAALGIKEATLLGHSYGGRMMIKLSARQQSDFVIKNMILVDSAGVMPKKSFMQKLKIRKYKILKTFAANRLLYALFPELIDEWRSRQGSADYRNASPMMRSCLVLSVNEDLTGLFEKVKEEVLLIWGEKDTATPLSDAKLMEARMPDAALAVVKDAGHYPFLDDPACFAGILSSYLDGKKR